MVVARLDFRSWKLKNRVENVVDLDLLVPVLTMKMMNKLMPLLLIIQEGMDIDLPLLLLFGLGREKGLILMM